MGKENRDMFFHLSKIGKIVGTNDVSLREKINDSPVCAYLQSFLSCNYTRCTGFINDIDCFRFCLFNTVVASTQLHKWLVIIAIFFLFGNIICFIQNILKRGKLNIFLLFKEMDRVEEK